MIVEAISAGRTVPELLADGCGFRFDMNLTPRWFKRFRTPVIKASAALS